MTGQIGSIPSLYSDDYTDRTILNLFRSRMTRLLLAAFVLYAQLSIWLPAGWLNEAMRCCQATLSFMVLTGYWRRASVCFFVAGRWPETHNVVALGIWISWFSIFVNATWAVVYRLAGQPAWMLNNDYYTAWTMASSFAACLHVFAPNLIGPDLPKMDKIRFAVTGMVGLTMLLVVGIWRPDLSGFAEWMHEHLAEPDWMVNGLWNTIHNPSKVFTYFRL